MWKATDPVHDGFWAYIPRDESNWARDLVQGHVDSLYIRDEIKLSTWGHITSPCQNINIKSCKGPPQSCQHFQPYKAYARGDRWCQ